jgi:hypothetical protein
MFQTFRNGGTKLKQTCGCIRWLTLLVSITLKNEGKGDIYILVGTGELGENISKYF